MKILFVLSRFPYPILKGDKLRAFYQLLDLHKEHELHLVCLSEDHAYIEHLPKIHQYCKSIEVVYHSMADKYWNLVKGFFNHLPFQVNYFTSGKIKKLIASQIISKNIDVCYVQLIRMAENIDFNIPCTYYLDYMDSFSAGLAKRLPKTGFPANYFVKDELKRMIEYETKIAASFHGCSVISNADLHSFDESIKPKLKVLPNGVSDEFLNYDKDFKQDIDLVFTGNMSYYPNVKATEYLVKKILPAIEEKGLNNIKIYLVGTHPSSLVKSLASERVVVTGFVEDLRPYLRRAKLFVAPLFTGSGLQNKLLEAMATGLPVLTTPLTNESLGATMDKSILIAENADDFATQIVELLYKPKTLAEIGNRGREYTRQNYSWRQMNQKFVEALDQARRSRNK